MSQRQIVSTTDGKFIGVLFDPDEPMVFGGFLFTADKVEELADGVIRLSNSNYVIDAKEI